MFLTIAISLAITAHGNTNTKSDYKAKVASAAVTKNNSKNSSKLSTDVRFDGQLVGGRIQSPFESLTVVENEKEIDDLIGMRTNFSDRIMKSQGMR